MNNIFEELHLVYDEINDYYLQQEFLGFEGFNRKRELNDHAYYLFMFTRLEDHIKTKSNELIQSKKRELQQSPENWEHLRAWSVFDTDKMQFLDRVALLVKKGESDYQKLKQYYRLRNKLAHGEDYFQGSSNINDFTNPIVMPDVFYDFENWYYAL